MKEINRRHRSGASQTVAFVRAVFAGLVGLALLGAGRPLAAQRAQLERIVQRRMLPNGLEVIVIENHGVPLATVEVTVRNGSFTQSHEYAGLAHMYEHMFFKANEKFPEPDAYVDELSKLGAVFNASTREEEVNYYLTVSADSLEAGMSLLVQGFLGPKFRADELERERQVVLGEYDRNESSPFFRLEQVSGKRLYGAQWSRKNVIGDRDVILGTTPAKMRAIRDLYYVPNNAVLIVAGDVDPVRTFALADRIFGVWKRGADPFATSPIPPIPPLSASQAVVVEDDVNATTVLVQWHGPSVRRNEDATFVADVFSDVLNDPQSRFQRRLVDSGLWQAVGVNYYTLDHVGPISVSGQPTPGRFREAMRALFDELKTASSAGYVTAAELDATKAKRATTTQFGMERSSEFAHTIGFWWSVSGLEYYMKYIDEMAKRTAADLQRYAQAYIAGKPFVIGVLMPAAERRQLNLTERELLLLGAP